MAHIPDLSTFNGFIHLVVLCNWFKFLNVLCPWWYSEKLGTVTERYWAIRLRAVAWQLLEWVFSNYNFEVEGINSTVHEDIILTQTISGLEAVTAIHHPFLAQKAHALICYKKTVCQLDLRNVQVEDYDALITPEWFEKVMQGCLQDHTAEPIFATYRLEQNTLAHALTQPLEANYTIHGCTSVDDFDADISQEMHELASGSDTSTFYDSVGKHRHSSVGNDGSPVNLEPTSKCRHTKK
ncbi:hypothetical protein DXG01_013836 [Tephrocybe rancida]|nr:hypothetical protein DXG01_013836 [Tephrocybe rancida]